MRITKQIIDSKIARFNALDELNHQHHELQYAPVDVSLYQDLHVSGSVTIHRGVRDVRFRRQEDCWELAVFFKERHYPVSITVPRFIEKYCFDENLIPLSQATDMQTIFWFVHASHRAFDLLNYLAFSHGLPVIFYAKDAPLIPLPFCLHFKKLLEQGSLTLGGLARELVEKRIDNLNQIEHELQREFPSFIIARHCQDDFSHGFDPHQRYFLACGMKEGGFDVYLGLESDEGSQELLSATLSRHELPRVFEHIARLTGYNEPDKTL